MRVRPLMAARFLLQNLTAIIGEQNQEKRFANFSAPSQNVQLRLCLFFGGGQGAYPQTRSTPETRSTPQTQNPSRKRRVKWCPGTESNRRHGDFQSPALPTELPGRGGDLAPEILCRQVPACKREMSAENGLFWPSGAIERHIASQLGIRCGA